MSHAEKAYETLRSMILHRKLQPGHGLVVQALATELSMSITPVREAIQRLVSEGFLEVIPRKGTFVRSFTVEDFISSFEVAEAYEGMAAFLVAERVSNEIDLTEELEKLTRHVDEMSKHLSREEARQWAAMDTTFHTTLCLLSANQYLLRNYQTLRAQMDCVLWFVTPLHVDRKNSTMEHKGILEAVIRGDKESARKLSQDHRNNVRAILRTLAPVDVYGSDLTFSLRM